MILRLHLYIYTVFYKTFPNQWSICIKFVILRLHKYEHQLGFLGISSIIFLHCMLGFSFLEYFQKTKCECSLMLI